jgi:hypothetical protein
LWLVLAAVVALGLLLWRRSARQEAPTLPAAPQTQRLSDMARPQELHAGGQAAPSRAFDGEGKLPQREVSSDRIEARGYGPSNDNPSGRADNRRTEIVALQR